MSRPRKAHPFSVRFTEAEKAQLRQKAGGVPLGCYLRETALGTPGTARRAIGQPVKDSAALGRLLGLLGQSKLANNLNQLAKAANLGSLPVTVETEADLRNACAAIAQMRDLLLAALGLKVTALEKADSLTSIFGEGAGANAP
ncbi:MAG: plasmid mobilization relaxosome protein MobC [Afipia sp.]|nr:plasmid mobilization relaxosome protein MobC [Afipia sp.]